MWDRTPPNTQNAPVAQLDVAFEYESKGMQVRVLPGVQKMAQWHKRNGTANRLRSGAFVSSNLTWAT